MKFDKQVRFRQKLKDNFSGSAPSPFVGRFGYPNVNIGILSPQHIGNNAIYDDPKKWAKLNLSINSVSSLRENLVNSRMKSSIKDTEKFTTLVKEIGMAKRPVDVEVKLQHLNTQSKYDSFMAPLGPTGNVKEAKATSNPKISKQVDKVSDDELKAGDALEYLYKKRFDENSLSKILSVGVLGKDKKMVPTRWSITATDDTLGKHLITEIKEYKEHEPAGFFGSHLGNYFLVLLLPRAWSYELFEMMEGEDGFTHDLEGYKGRTSYANETTGGYYAPRLAILEYLKEKKRQASVIVYRFISKEYTTPLGVWVTREATRKALGNKISFSEERLAIMYARSLFKKKFGRELPKSHILTQKTLASF